MNINGSQAGLCSQRLKCNRFNILWSKTMRRVWRHIKMYEEKNRKTRKTMHGTQQNKRKRCKNRTLLVTIILEYSRTSFMSDPYDPAERYLLKFCTFGIYLTHLSTREWTARKLYNQNDIIEELSSMYLSNTQNKATHPFTFYRTKPKNIFPLNEMQQLVSTCSDSH